MEQIGNWQHRGACVGLGPELFFPERGERVDQAIALCATCPVREPCLEWALHHEQAGIWGATTGQERRAMRRQQGIRLASGPDFGGLCGDAPEHGTDAGYKRHRRAGEPACASCKAAHAQATTRRTAAA